MGKGGQGSRGEILDNRIHPDDDSTSNEKTPTGTSKWWNRGGMHVNENGMGINVFLGPMLLVLSSNDPLGMYNFAVVLTLAVNIFLAYYVHKMRTVFCVIAVPVYMSSLLLVGTLRHAIVPMLLLSTAIAMIRVGVCMSVCLHRYAAHAAFKCRPMTQLFLNILGCAAHQGGPIWWASQHRCHHKYCDMPRDPHSAIQVGTEQAFAFFAVHTTIDEEFSPKHNDTWYLRILDTWAFLVATIEMIFMACIFGREGLFVCYTSIWICQTITLWFNIANHPEDAPGKVCKAANHKAKPSSYFPLFLVLDFLYPLFGVVVSEGAHEDHHKHFMLAKRDPTDCAYFSFILPLQLMGLVWDVKVAAPE